MPQSSCSQTESSLVILGATLTILVSIDYDRKFQLAFKHLFHLFSHNVSTVFTLLIMHKKPRISSSLITFVNLVLIVLKTILGGDLLSYKILTSASAFISERILL